MDLTEKLLLWGRTHAAARNAARTAEQLRGPRSEAQQREAKALRESADRLHHEIYRELGVPPISAGRNPATAE
jgi:hypothetical protein